MTSIKLPHFLLTGDFSLNPPSVPRLSVDWYAKGGIFNRPSIIGVGEAGTEAVLPINRLDELMARAIEKVGGKAGTARIENNFNIANLTVRSDSDIQHIARELYLLQRRNERGYAL